MTEIAVGGGPTSHRGPGGRPPLSFQFQLHPEPSCRESRQQLKVTGMVLAIPLTAQTVIKVRLERWSCHIPNACY